MADINNQPPFWLEVKKEYVFDNFDKFACKGTKNS